LWEQLTSVVTQQAKTEINERAEIHWCFIRQIFLEHLTTFRSELDKYIPFNSYSKIFHWVRSAFEGPALQVHCEMNCVAEQLIELQSRQLWLDKLKNTLL